MAFVSMLTLTACGKSEIPNVIGMDYQKAKSLLESEGCDVTLVKQDASVILPNIGQERAIKKGEVFSENGEYDKNNESPVNGTRKVTIEYAADDYRPKTAEEKAAEKAAADKKATEAKAAADKKAAAEAEAAKKEAAVKAAADKKAAEEASRGTISNPITITFDQIKEMSVDDFAKKYKDKVISFDGFIYYLDQASGQSAKNVALCLDRTDPNGGAFKDGDFSFDYLYGDEVSVSLLWILDDANKANMAINERTIDGQADDLIPVNVTAKVTTTIDDSLGEDLKELSLETVELPNNKASVKSR